MIRIVASATVRLIADALGLLVASWIIDDMTLTASGFLIAVGLFSVTGLLIEPLLRQMAIKNAPVLLGSSALISTLVGLIVTALITDGLTIRGLGTWLAATVLVWAIGLAGRLLLPFVIFKKTLRRVSQNNA